MQSRGFSARVSLRLSSPKAQWRQHALTDQTEETSRGMSMSAWVNPNVDSYYSQIVLSTETNGNNWGIYHNQGGWYAWTGTSGWATGIESMHRTGSLRVLGRIVGVRSR